MKITNKTQLKQIIREELRIIIDDIPEVHPPWTADEEVERDIAHAAERESRELTKQFRKLLRKDIGRVWGDEAVARREEEAKIKAAESVIPRLMDALKLAAGESRDDKVKHIVYVLDNLQPGFYKPSKEEMASLRDEPAKAGGPPSRKLSGTIPSLGIDLN